MNGLAMICAGLVLLGAAPAFAEDGNGNPGTVNYFTPAQKERAFGASARAGYSPTLVEAYQDGNFFMRAEKGGERFEVTVVRSGQVYPGTPLTPLS